MKQASKIAALGAAILMLPLVSQADDKDVLEYRQHIMKSLNEQTASLGQIVSGAGPTENINAQVQTLALLAAVAAKSFDAKVQGGDAKPEIWTTGSADFAKQMANFVSKTAEMAKVSREQGTDQVVQLMVEALACKSCHDAYRAKK
jgi:cytochrome c556